MYRAEISSLAIQHGYSITDTEIIRIIMDCGEENIACIKERINHLPEKKKKKKKHRKPR